MLPAEEVFNPRQETVKHVFVRYFLEAVRQSKSYFLQAPHPIDDSHATSVFSYLEVGYERKPSEALLSLFETPREPLLVDIHLPVIAMQYLAILKTLRYFKGLEKGTAIFNDIFIDLFVSENFVSDGLGDNMPYKQKNLIPLNPLGLFIEAVYEGLYLNILEPGDHVYFYDDEKMLSLVYENGNRFLKVGSSEVLAKETIEIQDPIIKILRLNAARLHQLVSAPEKAIKQKNNFISRKNKHQSFRLGSVNVELDPHLIKKQCEILFGEILLEKYEPHLRYVYNAEIGFFTFTIRITYEDQLKLCMRFDDTFQRASENYLHFGAVEDHCYDLVIKKSLLTALSLSNSHSQLAKTKPSQVAPCTRPDKMPIAQSTPKLQADDAASSRKPAKQCPIHSTTYASFLKPPQKAVDLSQSKHPDFENLRAELLNIFKESKNFLKLYRNESLLVEMNSNRGPISVTFPPLNLKICKEFQGILKANGFDETRFSVSKVSHGERILIISGLQSGENGLISLLPATPQESPGKTFGA
jgi:hypothetical protein